MPDEKTQTQTRDARTRPVEAVRADLAAAVKRHGELQKVCEAQFTRRQAAMVRRDAAKRQWETNAANTGLEFDPSVFPDGLVIPPTDSPEAAAFHAIHETIERLENELARARRAAVEG